MSQLQVALARLQSLLGQSALLSQASAPGGRLEGDAHEIRGLRSDVVRGPELRKR